MIRAAYPALEGKIDRDGIKIHYEVFGDGEHTILFVVPWWPLIDSRCYKAQIPYFSEHFRCVTYDPRGNGKSDHPTDPEAYGMHNHMDDALAVMDAVGVDKTILFGLSCAGGLCAALAAHHPHRIEAMITIGTVSPFAPPHPERSVHDFQEVFDTHEGWQKYNRDYWLHNFPGFAEFFSQQMYPEPHSSKQIEDTIAWAAQTTGQSMVAADNGPANAEDPVTEEMYAKIQCPVLCIHGDKDHIIPQGNSEGVAFATKGEVVIIPGSGHGPHGRIPAKINILTRDFLARHLGTWRPNESIDASENLPRRASRRAKKVLYLSSPIGLGHVRRDLAISRELRILHPGLEVDWLAQDPVTRFLGTNNERVHSASSKLANESAHIESEAGEHTLNAFQAIRNMDEILIKNFMIFQEVIEAGTYDLVIADEAWDVDQYWHEHPELKKTQMAWLTDFVGWLPMSDNGAYEADLTRDYNSEMLSHIERYPRVRDRSIFVGNPQDVISASFGKDLPNMRDWVPQHFEFCGHVMGAHPSSFGTRNELRAQFGYQTGEKICLVTVGGSGVGGALIRRILAAYPAAKRAIPELRMIVVTGPRLDPSQFKLPDGVEVRAFVPDLDRHLAACDLALVQGGLTTCMELAAAGTPFLYFPLINHFEQNFHVAHRLEQYKAGRKMIFDESCPDRIAQAMMDELSRPRTSLPVETDGAMKAARMLSELL